MNPRTPPPRASPHDSPATQPQPVKPLADQQAPDTGLNTPTRQHPAPPTPPDSSSRSSTANASSLAASKSRISPSDESSPQHDTFSVDFAPHSSPITMKPLGGALDAPPNHEGITLQSSISFPSTQVSSIPSFSTSFSAASFAFSNSSALDSSTTTSQSSSSPRPSSPKLSEGTDQERTPNVYINGLPPHFPEQDLHELARPYGEVKSVRSFTRHVSEKPTGYGFVLYDSIESAAKCIAGLKKFRNIHPSFSKQIHKIPGTPYAQQGDSSPTEQDADSFKSRMNRLGDTASSNLYIEGLPMSIDEESLAALMQPHVIKSSRFFKTKLSDPPRIIAFVRLENRNAAEEIIERLHGRMVRGWNDPGCRISVRFADSPEQRELRRTERVPRGDGEQSPARLTIAQAALLNLRGQNLQPNKLPKPLSSATEQRLPPASQRSPLQDSFGTFSSPRSPAEILASSRNLLGLSGNPTHQLGSSQQTLPNFPANVDIQRLSQLLQNNAHIGAGYDVSGLGLGSLEAEYRANALAIQQAQLQALMNANAALLSANANASLSSARAHNQARNGFTPAEELLLQAHARMQQQQHHGAPSDSQRLDGDFAARPERAHAFGDASSQRGRLFQESLPPISEDEFHAGAAQHVDLQSGDSSNASSSGANQDSRSFVKPPSRAIEIVAPRDQSQPVGSEWQKIRRHSKSGSPDASASLIHSQPQSRSLTLPSPSPAISKTQRHFMQTSNDIRSNSFSYNSGISGHANASNSTPASNSYTSSKDGFHSQQHSVNNTSYVPREPYTRDQPHAVTSVEDRKQTSGSPPAISPALTYCSNSPSTLSPTTPYFHQDNFGGVSGAEDTKSGSVAKVNVPSSLH
ncbi:hypothetical protein CONPUDRAFT_168270 [Coniophora puteana RWD-64-598 SS2]|uniref:RRM domain-containing protein n=1 Tax=Coniophora puteana (strain RWD-64-598) TaxID=741705 RepID=A0A5M3MEH6_CONPW|nr:uncharacterized protein CONPUDRAFT_168270 [Coniophora puteana RWD-64-598 SS2]EIW77320.1 hypothetical protein CONPUDRAFT_168270 [Coniophora puteana RWD-64-598 SS2]